MLISEIKNRDDVMSSIIKELNGIGIKIRNEKHKQPNNKRRNKKIFNLSLHLLELDDGLLSNGSVAQIPKFVLQSCKRIQMELETEGLFRKTGSVRKQKLIQEHLEKGGSIDRSHNVLDIANLLKTFFRELPEPLIPQGVIQEGLLRCLIHFSSYEEKCEALMMLMLLLPPISVNTLAYFLQFLEVVVRHSNMNLMSTENLVKVLTPTLMPVPSNAPQKRLISHFKVIELLIENANLLGVVPDRMLKKENLPVVPLLTEEQKKKKRRSGSLNRVFSGFRKIVGAIGSSSESLDKSEELLEDDSSNATSAFNKTKKRPLDKLDIIMTSSKKKKDVLMTLTSLPEIDDPNSPSNKNLNVTTRKSFGDHKESPALSPTKRRWSFGKFTRSKSVVTVAQKQEEPARQDQVDHCMDAHYVKISKSEYEAFKDRLISIETKISHEFNLTKLDSVKAELGQDDSLLMNGPEKVQNKYNQTLHEVGKLEELDGKAEQLARRMSRDLKIRPSIEHGILRSPSARKIGSLRRKRDSATLLSRTRSWHLGQSSPKLLAKHAESDASQFITTASFYPKSNLKRSKPVQSVVTARPLPALPLPSLQPEKTVPEKPLRAKRENSDQFVTPSRGTTKQAPEIWTPATAFFNDSVKLLDVETPHHQESDDMFFKTPVRPKRLSSSRSTTKNENDMVKTPMLPPRMTPSKKFTPSLSTPNRSLDFSSMNKSSLHTPSMHDASSQGRESIIILRNRNAGMVAQKAKLFNGLTEGDVSQPVKIPRVIVNKKLEHVKNMLLDETPRKERRKAPSTLRSPRKSPRSPVGITKRTAQSPLKTIREVSGNQKVKWMNSDLLNEIASPKRKPLSQSNTPRRKSKTPNRDSAKKRRQTPSKSRFIRHLQTQESR